MASEFDKRLNERFDDASLDELMPEFNINEEWNRVSEKIGTRRKIKPIIWLSHAAALIVGLLVSWMLTKQWVGPNDTTPPEQVIVYKYIDTATRQEKTIEPEITNTETAIAIKDKPSPKKVQTESTKTPLPGKTVQPIPETIEEEQAEETLIAIKPEEATEITTEKETVIAAAPEKHRVAAVHLLDINNEDKEIMIEDAGIKLQYKDPVARLLSPTKLPGNDPHPGERQGVLRGFFEK